MVKTLAVFDFDGTLIKGDSLWFFIKALHGSIMGSAMFITALLLAPLTSDFYHDPRTAIKKVWLRRALRYLNIQRILPAAEKVRNNLRWKEQQLQALRDWKAKGATIIIATGALDIYINVLLQGLPVDVVFCTATERTGTVLSGEIAANAVRATKAIQVQDYIKRYGPFDQVIGYGNLPNDRTMLALCSEQHVI